MALLFEEPGLDGAGLFDRVSDAMNLSSPRFSSDFGGWYYFTRHACA